MKRSSMVLVTASLIGFVACEQRPAEEVQQVPEVQEMPEAQPMTPAPPPTAAPTPMDTTMMQQPQQPTDTMPMQ